jgi:hypothetical protein
VTSATLFQADIAAPAAAIWDLLIKVEDWPAWTPTMTRIVSLSGQPLAVGQAYRVEQPGLLPAVYTVTGLDAPRRFVWEARTPGARLIADHVIEAAADGSRLSLIFTACGPLAPLIRGLLGGKIASFVETEGRSLKRAAEAAAARDLGA